MCIYIVDGYGLNLLYRNCLILLWHVKSFIRTKVYKSLKSSKSRELFTQSRKD